MRKLTIGLATMIALLVGLLMLGGQAMAAPDNVTLNWGSNINAGQCEQGTLVINITYKIVKDIDSAVGGFYWAYDNMNRHIQVWQTGDNTFCAVVQDAGPFITAGGKSPGGSGNTIAPGTKGTIQGGYMMTITGTLNPSPLYPSRGNIGAFNYDGDVETGDTPGYFNWLGGYFDSFSYDMPWWGWVYHAGRHGMWVNSSDGNEGDITD